MRRLTDTHPALPAALVALIAAAAWGVTYVNYDTFYALEWGREIAAGSQPVYDVTLAPTPHPLLTVAGLAVRPLGDAGPGAISVLVALSWVALIAATYVLGTRLFGPWGGAIAAVALATREPLVSWALRGFVDIPFLALVVSAAAIEAGRARAGRPVLALLVVAGLLRPEAWALAGLYALWSWPEIARRERIVVAGFVAAGPLLWALFDLLAAGDPLHSFTGTRDNVETLERPTGLDDVPFRFARLLGFLTQEPGVVGAAGLLAGLALTVRYRDKVGAVLAHPGLVRAAAPAGRAGAAPRLGRLRPLVLAPAVGTTLRAAALPVAMIAAGLAVFAAYGLVGLPLISRYLTVPAAGLLVLCGATLVGWGRLPAGRAREAWRLAAAAGGLLLLLTTPFQAQRLVDLHGRSVDRDKIQNDLVALAQQPGASRAIARCPRVYVPNHRPVPILAWALERSPREILSAAVEPPGDGAFVAPRDERVKRLFTLDRRDPTPLDATPPEGYREVAGNRSWVLLTRGCG
ncbi:MAG: hypothetical protein ACR2NA_00160 [Solirubrobacterales bacterium]